MWSETVNGWGVGMADGNLEPTPNGGCRYVRHSMWKMTNSSSSSAYIDSDSLSVACTSSLVFSSLSFSRRLTLLWISPSSVSFLCFSLALNCSLFFPSVHKGWQERLFTFDPQFSCEFNMNRPFWSVTGGMSLGIGE